MKVFGLGCALILIFSIVSGCASNKAEKDAYFEEGKMDEQVESWNKRPHSGSSTHPVL